MSETPSNPAPTNGDAPALSAGATAARRRGLPGSSGSTPNRAVAWFRGWTRRNLGREQMTAFFKTLLWVGPLTLLIWVYAERQQLDKRPQVTRPVEVVLNDPTKIVRIIRPADKNIVLTLEGPKAALDRFTEQGNPLAGNPPLQIVLDGTVTDGVVTRIKTTRVGQDKRFLDAGITVVSAVPEEIEILIDPIVEVDAQVVSDDPTVRATFAPPTVKVRGPRSVVRPAELARDNAKLTVRAGLKERVAQLSAAEANNLPDVKLTTDLNDPNVTILPPVVSARVEKGRESEYTIPLVRVLTAATPQVLNEYVVELADGLTIADVPVIGPEDQIELLRPHPTEERPVPLAIAVISKAPTNPNGEILVKLKWDLPPNVRVKEAAPSQVRVTFKPR